MAACNSRTGVTIELTLAFRSPTLRLHFSLSSNSQPVPFEYPHFLTGAAHKWIGDNDLHDGLSLYSLGWLQGGRASGGGLDFPKGGRWFISAPDTVAGDDLLSRIANGALRAPAVCCGMEIVEIYAQPTPAFGRRHVFSADSPIFIRGPRTPDGLDPHLTYDDPNADRILTDILRKKLISAGFEEFSADATVRFDRGFKSPKTRLIQIRESRKRANVCPVIVEGAPEAVRFAWCAGIGHLTGSGFGSIR